MASDLTLEEVVESMYKEVASVQGRKKLKPMDLQKMIYERFSDRADKRTCKKLGKEAIKELINSGRCVYSYYGGSFIELPPAEGVDK